MSVFTIEAEHFENLELPATVLEEDLKIPVVPGTWTKTKINNVNYKVTGQHNTI